MPELVEAICDELAQRPGFQRLDPQQPYLFAGHSMGAAIAFEIVRELRRRGLPLPQALIASSCRAPHLRRGWTPPAEPDEAELRSQLAALNAPQILDESAIAALLPILAADTSLFRRYSYEAEAPLFLPITAILVSNEPNLSLEQVQAWEVETSAGFHFLSAPGGHFWLREQPRLFQQQVLASLLFGTPPNSL